MKKSVKKLISILLCAAVFLCSLPFAAYADDSLANLENAISL